MDVLEELVRDNRVEVNSTLAANVMPNGASKLMIVVVDSIVH